VEYSKKAEKLELFRIFAKNISRWRGRPSVP